MIQGGLREQALLYLSMQKAHQLKHFQSLQQLAASVFQAMSFVYDQHSPVDLCQFLTIGNDHLEGCYQHVKAVYLRNALPLQTLEPTC